MKHTKQIFSIVTSLALTLFALIAPAQDAKPVEATKAVPTISDAHQKDFFKKQIAFIQAQSLLQQSIDAMNKDCGDGYVVNVNPQGDPFCLLKPETQKVTPAPPSKKKE